MLLYNHVFFLYVSVFIRVVRNYCKNIIKSTVDYFFPFRFVCQ